MGECYPSEQLEEGEIVDDDDFEDISDNSIIDSTFGKFVTSNENLRALSLSSDSETDIHKNVKRKRKLLHRKNKIKHQRKRKRRRLSSAVSDSSDSDISTCRDLKGKLKEAIHISGVEGGHKNTLETRLKGMGGLGNDVESPNSPPEPPPKINDNPDNFDKIDDNELEKLRIEALKTAILNKCQRRKKKKALLEGQKDESKPLETLDNKENNTPKDEVGAIKKNNIEKVESVNPVDMEEDEDVLRASLLAALAKKITKVQAANENIVKTKQIPPKLPISIPPVLPKPQINNFSNNVNKKVIQNRPKPQVKPLIIKVDDSDSDEEIKRKPSNVAPKVADLNVITNSVDKFLKEQRAKFETETKKRFQIVNKNKNKLLEKSAVKLLPKSQQIEYQQLLRQLKNAERRKRAKKLALQKLKTEPKPKTVTEQPKVTIEISSQAPTAEVVRPLNETALTPTVEVVVKPPIIEANSGEKNPKSDNIVSKQEQESKESDSEKKKSGITSELTTLQRTLKEIKMQRNGSLQIKSKYQVLTPIIRKITATSNERKKQEQRIKNLLRELDEARSNLSKSHERFSALVKELVDKKEKIDRSYEEKTAAKKKQNGNIIKKPINENVINNHEEQRQIRQIDNVRKDTKSVPVTSTPIKLQPNACLMEEATISTIITNSTNNDYEDMDVCNSDETDMCQIDIVDPNDIDQIFKRKSVVKSTIPEYVSPLNLNTYERYRHVDPLGIMCPYEVNGSCRDLDCTFKHYLKNHDRL